MEGPPASGPSALCGVMVNDRTREGLISRQSDTGVLVTARSDPTSYRMFCLGRYEDCPVWQAEREREWERKRLLDAGMA
jgi:hypothetical protein